MKILGIDYGLKRVGIAVGDTDYKISTALAFIENKGVNFVISKIEELVGREQAEKIILGYPIGLSGKDTKQTDEVKKFAEKLGETVKIPVIMEDERLTTRIASDSLRERGIKSGKKRQKIDSIAAQLILQAYFERAI